MSIDYETKQATFNKVVLHLLKQGMKSVNEAGDCMYRGGNGRSCAIGCLISDDVYHASAEGETSRNINVLNMLYQSNPSILGVTNIHDLIEDLQRVHDNTDASRWPYFLTGVANRYSLSDDVIVKHVNVAEGLRRLGEAMKKQAQDESDAQV